MSFRFLIHTALAGLLILTVIGLTGLPADAAAKKKKSKADVEVEKLLEPITTNLSPLTQKGAAHGLFSPAEVAKTNDLKLQLMDLMIEYPTSQLLVKPVFQSARLFKSREMYDDAYDFFNFIQTNFASNPYAAQSRVEIQRLKQQLGEAYFASDAAGAAPAAK